MVATTDPDAYGTDAARPRLIVEVADSSLRFDLGVKAALYAEAGVPEYWVVNLVERVLVVFEEPRDGSYQRRAIHEPGASLALAQWPDVVIDVSSLFPREPG